MKCAKQLGLSVAAAALLLTGCAGNAAKTEQAKAPEQAAAAAANTPTAKTDKPHINQAPVQPIIKRNGNVVNIEMTAQITDVEIAKGVTYNAWTFNGTVPGPVIRVKEGDTIHFTLKNMDPSIPHSMDFHAVHAAPSKKFINVMPNESGTFTYPADRPGVFMYHCGTKPVLAHIANGMYGMIIVEPKNGYPTDKEINRSYTIVQSEFYKEHDLNSFTNDQPNYVVFNGKAGALVEQPLLAKVGDRVRLYVANMGPNQVSSFHVVGTILDRVYLDGNPNNILTGMQTVMLPASGAAVVEFTVTEEGDYPIVTHQFNHVQKGAVGILRVTKDGKDNGTAAMSH